jgi:hypothetical protein
VSDAALWLIRRQREPDGVFLVRRDGRDNDVTDALIPRRTSFTLPAAGAFPGAQIRPPPLSARWAQSAR